MSNKKISELCSEYIEEAGKNNINYKILKVWRSISGECGIKHTKAVFLEEGTKVLHIYLDSSSLIQDFTTDTEMYISRLEYMGVNVDNIKFQLSKFPSKTSDVPKNLLDNKKELPPLNSEDKEFSENLCSKLNPSIKDNAQDAVEANLRRGPNW